MIKVKKSKVSIDGKGQDLLKELTVLLSTISADKDFMEVIDAIIYLIPENRSKNDKIMKNAYIKLKEVLEIIKDFDGD